MDGNGSSSWVITGRPKGRVVYLAIEIIIHKMMAWYNFLNGGQVGRSKDGLDHSLVGSIELVHVNGLT